MKWNETNNKCVSQNKWYLMIKKIQQQQKNTHYNSYSNSNPNNINKNAD